MKFKLLFTSLVLSWGGFMGHVQADNPPIPQVSDNDCPAVLNFHKRSLSSSDEVHLCEAYKGKVLLIVNTASECGFTPQYEGLQKLYTEYKERDFEILGFPSNDFGGQEPRSSKDIQNFCQLNYGVEFPMFEKLHAAKKNADPLYKVLGSSKGYPRWNFYKYLIDREGNIVKKFSSFTSPESGSLRKAIEALL